MTRLAAPPQLPLAEIDGNCLVIHSMDGSHTTRLPLSPTPRFADEVALALARYYEAGRISVKRAVLDAIGDHRV